MPYLLSLGFNGVKVYGFIIKNELRDDQHEHKNFGKQENLNFKDNKVSEQLYLSAHYIDGTMGIQIKQTNHGIDRTKNV